MKLTATPWMGEPDNQQKKDNCLVCDGMGTYPIYDRNGEHLYDITCPECSGLGKIEDIERLARLP